MIENIKTCFTKRNKRYYVIQLTLKRYIIITFSLHKFYFETIKIPLCEHLIIR